MQEMIVMTVNNSQPYHVEAEVTFLRPEEGGRSNPVRSGYRGSFVRGGEYWDVEHIYPDNETVEPGQTVRVLLEFMRPEAHWEELYEGMEFEVCEGPNVVARGRITKLIGL